MTGFNIRNEETYDNLGVTNDTNSRTIGTDLLSLIPSDIPTTNVSDGAIIYDKAANEFKGYINGSWQTITAGGSIPVVSANDKEVLFNNTSANELQGSSELQWDNTNTDSKLTIGSDSYLVLTPKTGAAPGSAPDGAIKYFQGDLQFNKAGTWTSLTQVGGASNAAGPDHSIQFNGGSGTFGGDSDFNFYPQGTVTPLGFQLAYNLVDIGDVFGTPTGKTHFVYKSDVNNNTFVQFDDTSGVNVELSKTASSQGDDSFYVKSYAQGTSQSAALQNKIRLETVDGETHLYSFRRTNGPEYGEGNIKLSTNTGEIRLETLGENSGGGVPSGPNGGTINIIGNDSDINLETTTRAGNNRKIKLSCLGSRSGLNDEGIRLETIRQPSGAGSTYSNNIELSTVGGDVKIETTGIGGSATTGKISLNSGTTNSIDLEAGVDISLDGGQNINIDGVQDINIASSTGDVNLTGNSIKTKNKLEVQTSASATTIELDGSSDGVITVGSNSNDNGNIKIKNTKSGTGSGVGYAVRVGSDSTNQSGRIQITNNSDQVTMDINGGDATGNSQPYIILRDYIGSSGKELFIRSLQNNKGCIEGNTNQNTMIIDSNGGSSVGSAEHGQMIFTSSGSTSGSIPVMKIERSDFSDDATPTLQLERPLRLWNATTTNITNSTKGLAQVGDIGFDTDQDVIKYRDSNGVRTIGGSGLTTETLGPIHFYQLTSGSSGAWTATSPITLLNYPALFPLTGLNFGATSAHDALNPNGGCPLLCQTGLAGGNIKYITSCAFGFSVGGNTVVNNPWQLRLVKNPGNTTLWTSPSAVISNVASNLTNGYTRDFAVSGATFNTGDSIEIQVVNGSWDPTYNSIQKAFLTVKLYIEYD